MSPLESAIQFLRMTLLGETAVFDGSQSSDFMPENIAPILPPQYQAPPDLFPNGQDTFLPPLNPGGISVLPPFNPIGPYNPQAGGSQGMPQDPNEVPQDIADLLAGR